MNLPPPTAFGLPQKFGYWRPDQQQAFTLMLDAPTRFVGLTMPTGSGKSLSYIAALTLFGGRGVILTSTKGLQDQLSDEFHGLGLLDLRGQRNYPCRALLPDGEFADFLSPHEGHLSSCEEGPCHAGAKCTLKEAGCSYYDTVRQAQTKSVITNYALWLAQRRYSQGLGQVDFLVLDEAHQAFDELSSALSIKLEKWLLAAVHLTSNPPVGSGMQSWKDWAQFHSNKLKHKLEHLPQPSNSSDLKYRRRIKAVERQLSAIGDMELGNWVEDHTDQAWVFEVINPAKYAEQYLFQGAKRVVMLSATLIPKTLVSLGIHPQNFTHWECPSRFPVARRPIYYVPTVPVDSKMKPEHWSAWGHRIDQIIAPRQDRKSLIHTVSYQRRDRYLVLSGFSTGPHPYLLTHGNKPGEVQAVVKYFKQRQQPGGLVSPSLGTGWDFPYDQCRFQIITKLPIPDSRTAVMKARTELDPDYPMYLTALALVQMAGRGMRAPDDWCETFLIDDHWRWFQKHRKFMPQWFLDAVMLMRLIPKPMTM